MNQSVSFYVDREADTIFAVKEPHDDLFSGWELLDHVWTEAIPSADLVHNGRSISQQQLEWEYQHVFGKPLPPLPD